MNSRLLRALRVLGVTVVGGLSLTGTAWADEPASTVASQATCSDPQLERPFLAFKDARDYVLAPGGSFEDPSTPGWQLEGGASVVAENEPFDIRGLGDSYSLRLPAGASATSPTMCVDLHFPTMRFVGMQEADKDADLDIEVVYPNAPKGDGNEWHKTKSLKAKNKDGWQITKDVDLHPDRGGKKSGWRMVALRFTADDHQGSWLIDNIYVDPRMR
jgi:hypothetical protein